MVLLTDGKVGEGALLSPQNDTEVGFCLARAPGRSDRSGLLSHL